MFASGSLHSTTGVVNPGPQEPVSSLFSSCFCLTHYRLPGSGSGLHPSVWDGWKTSSAVVLEEQVWPPLLYNKRWNEGMNSKRNDAGGIQANDKKDMQKICKVCFSLIRFLGNYYNHCLQGYSLHLVAKTIV